jgi:predicted transcriptional regulator
MPNSQSPHLDETDLKLLALIDERLTYAEMAERVERRARSGVFRRLMRLASLGLIEKDARKARMRRLTSDGRRTLNRLTARSR